MKMPVPLGSALKAMYPSPLGGGGGEGIVISHYLRVGEGNSNISHFAISEYCETLDITKKKSLFLLPSLLGHIYL